MRILVCASYSRDNDYIRLLTEAYVEAGHTVILGPENLLYSNFVPDVLHLHWPEQFYKQHEHLARTTSSIQLLRKKLEDLGTKGVTIVYTLHNLRPHEISEAAFEDEIYRLFASTADVIVHHGKASITAARDRWPECSRAWHVVAPHGSYETAPVSRAVARAKYNFPSDKMVLLNFGLQRRYKGLFFLEAVLAGLDKDKLHLFTIGPYSPSPRTLCQHARKQLTLMRNLLTQRIRSNFFGHTRVIRNVPNDEISEIMAAVDMVMLGHQSGINSGLLALAASYSKPVVYPALGNFAEQLDGWILAEHYTPADKDSASAAVERLVRRLVQVDETEISNSHANWLARHTWSAHVEVVLANLGKSG